MERQDAEDPTCVTLHPGLQHYQSRVFPHGEYPQARSEQLFCFLGRKIIAPVHFVSFFWLCKYWQGKLLFILILLSASEHSFLLSGTWCIINISEYTNVSGDPGWLSSHHQISALDLNRCSLHMLLRALAQNICGNTCLEGAYNLVTLWTDRHHASSLPCITDLTCWLTYMLLNNIQSILADVFFL